jgi:phosphoribosyl-AMP cyclohydrolase
MSEAIAREEFLSQVVFDTAGLVPVIAQDHKSGAVLMLAWMNRETLALTLESGDVIYWSRSRGEVWRKGATSGHTQRLIEAWIDCDGDALLMKIDQTGPACHTGAAACFFRRLAP